MTQITIQTLRIMEKKSEKTQVYNVIIMDRVAFNSSLADKYYKEK